eukprot:TRINITY_DN698_c0_g1_i1.p1 TRINITY_DN698_c0_g1~~TRINITY_DN698_c0_g1_i1.p1  ORF type:complete len:515 (-),score=20.69 TRINITY_DN698_c0_g1_i1:1240-2784(-)
MSYFPDLIGESIQKIFPEIGMSMKQQEMEALGGNFKAKVNKLFIKDEKLLGYTIKLTKIVKESPSLTTDSSASITMLAYPHFAYNSKYNAFVLSTNHTILQEKNVEPTQFNTLIFEPVPSRPEVLKGFYGQIRRYLSSISMDPYSLTYWPKGPLPNYAENVKLYRVNADSSFDEIKNTEVQLFGKDRVNIDETTLTTRRNKRKEHSKDLERYIKTTLKSKNSFLKIINSLPLPRTFAWLLSFLILMLVATFAVAIAHYEVFKSHFSGIINELPKVQTLTTLCVDAFEASTLISQAIIVNLYSFPFNVTENIEADGTSTIPIRDTQARPISLSMSRRNSNKLQELLNKGEDQGLDTCLTSEAVFSFTGPSGSSVNTTFFNSYKLVYPFPLKKQLLDDLREISLFNNLTDFVSYDQKIIEYEINLKGAISTVMAQVPQFVEALRKSVNENTVRVENIAFGLLGMIAAAALGLLIVVYFVSKSVFYQARLLLRIPESKCRYQQSALIRFINQIQVLY